MKRMSTEACKLDHEYYAKFKDFILDETGLSFPKKKRSDLERAVLQGLSESPCRAIDEYFDFLVNGSMDGAMDYLVRHLTVGETYFYRDQDQLELLQNEIFPKLISERAVQTRKLRVWSAGCATGEEPYSLAIIMRELIPYIDMWDCLVLATDINKESLKRAESGRYTNWSFRSMPQSWLEKYFFISSENEYHLSETIKKNVVFSHLNLKKQLCPTSINIGSDLDLIICRNVAIYFDEKTINQIMENFYHCLSDGGWLLMGASDPIPPKKLFWMRNYSGVFIYQKKSESYDSRHVNRKGNRSGRITVAETSLSAKSKRRQIKKPAPTDALAESRALLEIGQPVLATEKLEARLKEEPKS
ncbi:MAG TPA: protein-glutamate O-methyltransferase CheR, partial [Actinobacteria bacterium]|nr:protein-glutamate O-methyltransferase CheR [Actinomycetota bacterium]